MGLLTQGEIVEAGTLQAGREEIFDLAQGWLQRWLNSRAAAFPWAELKKEATALSISGTSGTLFGNGNGGVTDYILRVLDNVWVYNTDANRTGRRRVRIRTQLTEPTDRIERTDATGTPYQARVFRESEGAWRLYWDPYPDRTYYVTLPYIKQPAQLATDDEDAVPWYPHDETMVQAVAFACHRHYNGVDDPKTQAQGEILRAMASEDLLRYGSVNGINDRLQLNAARFPRANKP